MVSLDAIREALDVDPARPQGAVVDAARQAVRAHLRAGRDFAWNATFVSRALRQRAVTLAAEYGARVRIVTVEAPEAVLRERNRQRVAPVPDAVIDRLIDRWEAPDLTEAHAVERGGTSSAHCAPAPP
jgi:predicted kinase